MLKGCQQGRSWVATYLFQLAFLTFGCTYFFYLFTDFFWLIDYNVLNTKHLNVEQKVEKLNLCNRNSVVL